MCRDFRAKTARMVQPTYQLKPTSNFSGTQINKIASDLLDLYLNDVTYSPELCRQKSKEIARAITDAIKKLGLTRYDGLPIGQLVGRRLSDNSCHNYHPSISC